jgi:hypothetical protein
VKIVICGDRNWTNRKQISKVLQKYINPPTPSEITIIHGAANGADSIAGEVAEELGFNVESYPANWEKHGRAAGPIRNREMLDQNPDLVIFFHKDLKKSKGTLDNVVESLKRGIQVWDGTRL